MSGWIGGCLEILVHIAQSEIILIWRVVTENEYECVRDVDCAACIVDFLERS